MRHRVLRGAGSLAMLWSLVVLGAPAPLTDCGMASMGSASGGMAMPHHHATAEKPGKQPTSPRHEAGRAPCCSLTCGCGSFAPLPEWSAAARVVAAIESEARPVALEQGTSSRPPHSQPFAHAPPLI